MQCISEARYNGVLSHGCFGLVAAHSRMDLAFPMDGSVTEERLLSLFDPLLPASGGAGHGTVVYFVPRTDGGVPVVAPTPDGRSVCAASVAIHDLLPCRWMLPHNAAMPVELGYGAPAGAAWGTGDLLADLALQPAAAGGHVQRCLDPTHGAAAVCSRCVPAPPAGEEHLWELRSTTRSASAEKWCVRKRVGQERCRLPHSRSPVGPRPVLTEGPTHPTAGCAAS